MTWVGRSALRKEGDRKLRGLAKYIDDISFPDMLHGVTIRSSIARGILREIEYLPGVNWDDFVKVTANDIPGHNYVALLEKDQPYLVEKQINHPEEPVLLLAHPDKQLLEKARTLVKIHADPLPPIFSMEESAKQQSLIWGTNNTFKKYAIDRGDIRSAFENAAVILEGTYETGAQEQLYIEPNGVIAMAHKSEGVTVWGSMQCPYYVHKALLPLFNLPAEKIRVIQTETGGGFGGKEEYPSMIAGHAALLAWKSGKPVKLIYDRMEDMVATTKRHPSKTVIRTAFDHQNKLIAIDIDFTIDGGAYCTLSPVVLSRGTLHASGPYFSPNVKIRSRALATNTPPHGAFRGFGAPQSLFALEKHMDYCARKLNVDPVTFRKSNLIQQGQMLGCGQIVNEKIKIKDVLDRALKESDFKRKQKSFRQHNKKSPLKKGIGLSVFMHGAGFTGSGETFLASIASVKATPEGKIEVLTSNTEIGQGTNTIFSQMAADALHLDFEDITVVQPDTSRVPNSGPTVASRTCMIVGKLVELAALDLKQKLIAAKLLKEKYQRKEFISACKKYLKEVGELKGNSQYKAPPNVVWDEEKYQGDAYGTYAWATYVAETTTDIRTFETTVDKFWAVQEVGKVINPTLAKGQIVGGVAQGIGYALYEDIVWKEGRMANNKMSNYIIPTTLDTPEIEVHFMELPYSFGGGGSKGIGELPLDGPGPAILNAMEYALDVQLNFIPMTPEKLMKQMDNGAS
ncbi:MAG: xanthine dehydrogenase family protein molybdopterin-binding subunit [Deltaproteobacteria bacterium]